MQETLISWATHTWNAVLGCSKLDQACRSCYAEAISLRFGLTPLPWTAKNASANVQLKPHKLREPYALKAPARIFVNSMSDAFHPLVPDDYLARMFAVMNDLPQHQFLVLTKRPERAATWPGPWTDNIWQGTTIGDRKALHRLDTLRQCGARVKFLSLEPLLEDLGIMDLTDISWIVVGGESGRYHRPMPHQWARNIRDQCIGQNIPFFFKQSSHYQNEKGCSLREQDDSFYTWRQFPDDLAAPTPAPPHKYTCE